MMNEREIVKLFLDRGYQLSNNVLPLVLLDPESILSNLDILKPRPFIVTENHVKQIFEAQEKIEKKIKTKIKILKTFTVEKKPITVGDYTQHLLSRYEKLKNLLVDNTNLEKLVSINKITPKMTDFSVIVMIREKNNGDILVEDPTGEIYIHFSGLMKHKLSEIEVDDVVGMRCRRVGGEYHAVAVMYPDVPISREVVHADSDLKLVISKQKEKIKELVGGNNTTLIFSSDDIPVKENPVLADIGGVKTLVLPSGSVGDIIKMLKRRYLVSPYHTHGFVLDDVPDIIVSNGKPSGWKNYKGSTIVVCGDSIFVVDLKTREVENIN